MANKLKDLVVKEISLVDNPACPGARVVLFKRADEDVGKQEGGEGLSLRDLFAKLFKRDHGPKMFATAMTQSKFEDQWWRTQDALRSSIYSILESDAENKGQLIQESLAQFVTHMHGVMGEMDDVHKSVVAKLESPLGELVGVAEEIAKANQVSDDNMERVKTAMATIQEIWGSAKADVSKVKKEERESMKLADVLKALGLDLDKQVDPAPEGDGKTVTKVEGSEEIAKQFEDLRKQAEAAQTQVAELKKAAEDADKRAKAAEEIAKAEMEKRVEREYLEKAAQYPHMGAAVDVAKRLRKAYEMDAEFGKQLEEDFGKANAAIETSKLFDEAGRTVVVREGSAEAKLDALAKSLVAKDASMTYEQAYVKALETPEGARFYEDNLRERGAN